MKEVEILKENAKEAAKTIAWLQSVVKRKDEIIKGYEELHKPVDKLPSNPPTIR